MVGDNDFVLGFKLIGIRRIYKGSTAEELRGVFSSVISDKSIGILVTDEQSISKLDPVYRKTVENSISPVVVVLSKNDSGQQNLRDLIKKAIGIDLMAK
ncbi:MAG: V-type ATP synthase subunit F [archaeon]